MLPWSVLWLHQAPPQARMVVPTEVMRIQGIYLGQIGVDIQPLAKKSDGQLSAAEVAKSFARREAMHLAGNAFNVYSFTTTVIIGATARRPTSTTSPWARWPCPTGRP